MPIVSYGNSRAKSDSINNYTIYNINDGPTDSDIKSILENLRGIFAIPYQFLPTCDPRIIVNGQEINVGAKYAEKIVARMPLLFMVPCRQKFMDGYDNETQSSVISALLSGGDDFLSEVITKNGKYYKTEWQWDEYYKYVNTLCNQVAIFMGVENEELPVNSGRYKKIKDIDWSKDLDNDAFDNYFMAKQAVIYYVDGASVNQMSENFNNMTTESSLASQLNGYSDTANEIKFLFGNGSAISGMLSEAEDAVTSGIVSNLAESFSSMTGGMLSDLATKGTSSLLSGGKLVFPKLWQDSSFSRSYSFDIKLRSPDHDNLSIFLNIMVPYLHLLALVLPISHEDYANSYNAPFLVRAYCKGLFNIDMGMITDMQVTRGAECQWNDDGLPTQMDISISIEDLYSSLYMSAMKETSPPYLLNQIKSNLSVVKNTSMLDYLANLSGLNIAEEEKFRSVHMFMKLGGSVWSQATNNLYNKFDVGVSRVIEKLYHL